MARGGGCYLTSHVASAVLQRYLSTIALTAACKHLHAACSLYGLGARWHDALATAVGAGSSIPHASVAFCGMQQLHNSGKRRVCLCPRAISRAEKEGGEILPECDTASRPDIPRIPPIKYSTHDKATRSKPTLGKQQRGLRRGA